MHGFRSDTIDWSVDTIAMMTRMWADGHSSSEIARKIPNATRSAVIGKIRRLDLPHPAGKPVRSVGARRPPKQPAAPPAPPPAARLRNGYDPALRRNPSHNILAAIAIAGTEPGLPEKLKGEAPDGTGIKLIDLDKSTCHWPKGDPLESDFEFCGGYAVDGLPYCAHHTRMAYLPTQSRNRAMQKVGG